MPRKTAAQVREEEIVRQFENALGLLSDPRRRQGTRYPLKSVVVIALMGMVCGCGDAEALELRGQTNEEWLRNMLDLPHGPPTQDVFLSLFAALDPKEFSTVFIAWTQMIVTRLSLQGKHIAVDGKTSRRSFGRDEAGNKTPALHTVSAWMSDAGLVLGQQKTAEKSNEITAIPELLKLIDIRGATITIDAMGCQTEIAKMPGKVLWNAAVLPPRGGMGGAIHFLATTASQPWAPPRLVRKLNLPMRNF